jgi:hypothetical protein
MSELTTTAASTAEQRDAFIAELDGVADVLRSQQPAHGRHQGWSLRSDGALLCSCGQELYPAHTSAVSAVP